MTRTLLLAAHIAVAAGWLGANYVQLLLSPRFAKEPAAATAAWNRHTMWLGQGYYGVLGALLLLTGAVLVLDGDWSWSAGFVSVGIAVVVIGGITGVAGFAPLGRQRAAAIEGGDEGRLAVVERRLRALAVFDTVLVLVAVVAMVDKWQA